MQNPPQFKVAALTALLLAPAAALAAAVDDLPGPSAGLAAGALSLAGVEHELRMEETRPGAETLVLTARLAAGGPEAVTASSQAGEILRVGAGQYRVESVLQPGNAAAEATVTVKPGILSAVEIAHRASIVRLDVPAGARWRLTETGGGWSLEGAGAREAVALKAGRYRLEQDGRAADFSVDGVSPRTVSFAAGD